MSFINPYNQSGMVGSSGFDRPSWQIPTTPSYTPRTGGSGFYDAGTIPGSLRSLTGEVTQTNIANQQAANAARIPNAPGLEAQSSSMIEDQLLGKLPADVLALLGTQSGERSAASGMVGAPNAGAAYLRALGLTSLQQQQTGQQNLSAAYARNPGGRVMDAESQIITPYQQAQLDLERERLDLAKSQSRGGGGGGGYYPRTSGTGTGEGGYTPTYNDIFGSGSNRRGYVFSNPEESVSPSFANYAGASNYGDQPVSSGRMLIGNQEDEPFWNYTTGGWEDEFFGNY